MRQIIIIKLFKSSLNKPYGVYYSLTSVLLVFH